MPLFDNGQMESDILCRNIGTDEPGYVLDGRRTGDRFPTREELFPSSAASRPALRPSLRPIQ
jgi:hypothetical protein